MRSPAKGEKSWSNAMMKKLWLREMFALVISLVVASSLIGLSGCKKISYDLTKNSELQDSPEYTVGFDQNLSPAEGEVKKAN